MKLSKWTMRIGGMLILGVAISLLHTTPTFAATKTWTGTAGDQQFNTAGNWSPSGAPTTGDDLVFPLSASDKAPNNNISSLSLASITFSGSGTDVYTLSGNALTLTGGITSNVSGAFTGYITSAITVSGTQSWSVAADNVIGMEGVLSGSGALTKTGTGTLSLTGASPSYSGAITASAGTLVIDDVTGLGSASAGTTIASGATLKLCDLNDLTVAEPLTIGGTGSGANAAIMAVTGCNGGGFSNKTFTLSGAVVLTANTTVSGNNSSVLRLTGALSGNYTMTVPTGSSLTLELAGSSNTTQTPNGTYTAGRSVTTIPAGDSQPGVSVSVGANNTYIIDGVRGDTTVSSGGILMGTGTVGVLTVNTGGQVAPGHSPGCLASGDLLLGGTYVVEIGGTTACTGYDQINVTGTVSLTGSILSTSLYGGFAPSAGQVYTIITNDGADAVTDTFTGLAEGATFSADGYLYRVSYVGGDGNDVTLTVVGVPGAPNTGVAMLTSNPALVSAAGAIAAGAVLLTTRKYLRNRK